jgi:hypothetical protein
MHYCDPANLFCTQDRCEPPTAQVVHASPRAPLGVTRPGSAPHTALSSMQFGSQVLLPCFLFQLEFCDTELLAVFFKLHI